MSLPTNLVDEQLDTSVNTKKHYAIKNVSDDSVVAADVYLEDNTTYSQQGSVVGSVIMNEITDDINKLNADVKAMVVVNSLPSTGTAGTLYFSKS